MTDTAGDGLTLGQIRRELAHLVALADTGERPRPTSINPPGHPMPGQEWRIEQRTAVEVAKPPTWWIRSVDTPDDCGAVYISTPDGMRPGDDFDCCLVPEDARRLAMALLAAADRVDHLVANVPRLEDRRKPR